MKKLYVLTLSFFSALLLLTSCGGASSKNETKEVRNPLVRVEEVKITEVDNLQSFTATIQAETVNNISPATGGRIRSISVDVGSNVRKGQTVVTMDNTNLSVQATQLATLKRDLDRYKELYNVGGISRQQLDQAETQYNVAKESLDNLAENTTLVSPINGVVTARNYDPGDMAGGLPILTVENINTVKLIVNVSEKYFNQIALGKDVDIKIDAIPDEVFQGKISLIHPTIDAITHTFPVEIKINNPGARIRPGMFSRVVINFGTRQSAVVADLAVLKQTGSNDRYVFIYDNGTALYRLVELGIRFNDKYEIISGLNQGDQVIVYGNTGLIDGTKVQIAQ